MPKRKDLKKYPRLFKLDPTRPWTYTLTMIDGDREDETDVQHKVLDSLEIERRYLPSYVDMIPVERGTLKGTLYIPQEEGKISVAGPEGGWGSQQARAP